MMVGITSEHVGALQTTLRVVRVDTNADDLDDTWIEIQTVTVRGSSAHINAVRLRINELEKIRKAVSGR